MSTSEVTTSQQTKKCVKCRIPLKKIVGKKVIDSDALANEITLFIDATASVGDIICSKCFVSFSFLKSKKKKAETAAQNPVITDLQPDSQQSSSSNPSTQSSTNDPSFLIQPKEKEAVECVDLPFQRPISTHTYCFLCKKITNIVNVPFKARQQVFSSHRIFIPDGNRCCKDHLINKRFYDDQIQNIRIVSHYSSIKTSDVVKLLENMGFDSSKELTDRIGDFSLSEERLITFTGLNWEKLIKLRDMMTSLRNTETRTVTQALVVFMFKMRTGNSNEVVSSVLGLDRPQQVYDFSASIFDSFERDVLPTRFGLKAVNRESLIRDHTTITVRELHNIKYDQLVLIADGTYIRHQKSSNNEYQRKSYSGQKKVPLCKPFTICTTDGYVVDVLGPFYANENDAKILDSLLNDNDDLRGLLRENDVFVLDRGFRDVIKQLEENKYCVLMPALKGQRKQLTAAESNHSRSVTLIRWVVEAIHGIVAQKYKILHHQLDNRLLPRAATFAKIACFLINEFGERLISKVSSSNLVLNQIKAQRTQENTIAVEAEVGRWSRRKTLFATLTSNDLTDFPEMTEQDLIIFFTGTYQMQQAISYLAEIMTDDEINVQYFKDNTDIIKLQVRSRHISSKTYNCYIQYRPNSIGYSSILRYCCECANGLRTVGCCSHVAAIVYYLSHARYLSKIVRPAEKLTSIYARTKVVPVIEEDSDED